MSKKSIIFIIIVIFTVSLISGVAIVLKEKQEKATVTEKPTTTTQEPSSQPATQPATPKPSGEPKSDSMGSWETYANQTYGFKVKYPRDWQVKEEPLPVYPDTFTVKVSFVSPSLKDKVVFNVRPKGDEGMIREAYSIVSEKKITVGGVVGDKIIGTGHKDGSVRETLILVTKDSYLYEIKGEGKNFDQMVSSFEFTK